MCLQDRGDSTYDPVYDKVLNGLNLVARHAATPLLDALLSWRKDAESQAQRAGPELVVLRKKVSWMQHTAYHCYVHQQ